jgi:REP element-mobilizing transposase RayT
MADPGGSRHSIRLPKYDYAQSGLYFVTTCTDNRSCLFGVVADGEMYLNEAGRMVHKVWESIPRFWDAEIDVFVVMPNHVHGIVVLGDARGSPETDRGFIPAAAGNPETRAPAPTKSEIVGGSPAPVLSTVVGRFKSFTSNQYRKGVRERNWLPVSGTLWQRKYYEHVIRNDADLDRIREYIINNPLSWHLDRENPDVFSSG